MLLPIAVIIAFSFNDPTGRYNFTWVGFTTEHWNNAFGIPELNDALLKSIKLAVLATLISTVIGTLIAMALVRYEFFGRRAGELPDRDPDGDARGRDRRRAALDVPDLRRRRSASTTLLIAHVMFCISFVVVVVRSRLIGFDRRLEEAARDLGATAARPSARSPCR